MEQLMLFKIRDLRKKDQFKIDDAYLNGYARVCGKEATLVYTSLCRHAEFHSQEAFPSQAKIAYEHKIAIRTVRKGLKKLTQYNIIVIQQERMKGKFMNYLYILLDKSVWKPLTMGTDSPTVNHGHQTKGRLTAYGVRSTKDNKQQRITNIKDNKEEIATQSVAGKEINDLIDLFKEVNPSYERLFRNKTQRACLERMVKKHSKEKIEWVLNILPKTNQIKYAPTITTPLQLEDKLGLWLAFIQKEKNREPKFIKI